MSVFKSLFWKRLAPFTAVVLALSWRSGSALPEEPWIRVRLFSDVPLTELSVSTQGSLHAPGRDLPPTLNVRVEGNHLLLAGPHALALRLPSLHLESRRGREIRLAAGADERKAVGSIDLKVSRGHLVVINAMPTEIYVMGVVEPELGSLDFPLESLKAQIVASRSYVLSMRGRHHREGFDFCDGPHCQMFRGTAGIQPRVIAAGAAVRGAYLAYGGRPIPAFYHDSCGGSTTSADAVWPVSPQPYLRVVQDGGAESYCRFAPKAHWHYAIQTRDLQRCLWRSGLLSERQPLLSVQVNQRDPSGRAQTLLVRDGRVHQVSARRARLAINRYFASEVLPSTLFHVTRRGSMFVFEGRGWGHGVGMCQWGAIEMAREGKTYQQILTHYFPGTTLDRLPVPIYASKSNSGA